MPWFTNHQPKTDSNEKGIYFQVCFFGKTLKILCENITFTRDETKCSFSSLQLHIHIQHPASNRNIKGRANKIFYYFQRYIRLNFMEKIYKNKSSKMFEFKTVNIKNLHRHHWLSNSDNHMSAIELHSSNDFYLLF